MERIKRHPVLYSLVLSAIISASVCVIFEENNWEDPSYIIGLFYLIIFGIFIVYPFLLTIINIITFVMKTLGWLFLIALYFSDVNPENRIAVQYLPKILK